MSRFVKHLSAVALAAVALTSAHAAEIAVSSVTASSTFFTYNVNNLINGNGLVVDQHTGAWENKWLLDGVTTGTVTFDLGSLFKVGSTTVWNYGPGCCGEGRSTKDLGISVSTDGANYTSAGNFVLNQVTTDPFPGQSLALNDVNARFVRFSINSNYGDAQYSGLSEVKFYGTAVPEAETYAYALFGLGVVGVALRRKAIKA